MKDKLKQARDMLLRESKKYENLTYTDGVLDMFNQAQKIESGTFIDTSEPDILTRRNKTN